MGVDITHVDVGGGLGVDYDGTNSTNNASVNYTLQEYANDVIYTIAEACREPSCPCRTSSASRGARSRRTTRCCS
jgi:arginine decarboxylase